MDLVTAIEIYLFEHPNWVPVWKICERFGIDERELRAQGRKRPLHSGFAISSTCKGQNGLKHICHATTAEKRRARHHAKKRIIAGARALRDINNAIANQVSGRWPHHLVDGNGNRRLAL